MPRGAYRLIFRYAEHKGNSHGRMLATTIDGNNISVVESSKQAKGYFLCESCERRFSEHGERRVIGEALRNERTFRLRELLQKERTRGRPLVPAGADGRPIQLQLRDSDTPLFWQDTDTEADSSAYQYFAISVLWRSVSFDWGRPHNFSYRRMSTAWEDHLRQFLLRECALHNGVRITVKVDFDNPSTCSVVSGIRVMRSLHPPGVLYEFIIPGMLFSIQLLGDPKKPAPLPVGYKRNIAFHQWSFIRDYDRTPMLHPSINGAEVKGAAARARASKLRIPEP